MREIHYCSLINQQCQNSFCGVDNSNCVVAKERFMNVHLADEVKAQNHELFHLNAEIETIFKWIKSDSVYTLLRYGSKSTTIIDGMDDLYQDLLHLSEQLRASDQADIDNRNDAFNQQLP